MVEGVLGFTALELLQKTLNINTETNGTLRCVLFKDIKTIRVNDTFERPEMATDLLESDLSKLNVLYQRGGESFAHHKAILENCWMFGTSNELTGSGKCQSPNHNLRLSRPCQGSVTQSKNTYEIIKAALESVDAKYKSRNFKVFLQGSYGNDTNIYAESDVDIVIRQDASLILRAPRCTDQQKNTFDTRFPESSDYSYSVFQSYVKAALTAHWLTR